MLRMDILKVSIKLSFPHVFSENPMSKPFMDARLNLSPHVTRIKHSSASLSGEHSGMTKCKIYVTRVNNWKWYYSLTPALI